MKNNLLRICEIIEQSQGWTQEELSLCSPVFLAARSAYFQQINGRDGYGSTSKQAD